MPRRCNEIVRQGSPLLYRARDHSAEQICGFFAHGCVGADTPFGILGGGRISRSSPARSKGIALLSEHLLSGAKEPTPLCHSEPQAKNHSPACGVCKRVGAPVHGLKHVPSTGAK